MGSHNAVAPRTRKETFMKHTFITADGREKTVNIPDEVLIQGRREGLNVTQTIERYLSDEGYVVNDTVAALTNKAKANGVNNAGRAASSSPNKRKAPTRKPDETKRMLIKSLDSFLDSLGMCENIEVTNIERMIAFSIGDDKYELTLSKKRKSKK